MPPLKILTLNCQKGYTKGMADFLNGTMLKREYDFILLQESSSVFSKSGMASGYSVLKPFATSEEHQLSIIHREEHEVGDWEFSDFGVFSKIDLSEYGFLIGNFSVGEEKIIVGSAHLHSGLRMGLRARELSLIKSRLLEFNRERARVVIGGDFNSGFPGEPERHRKLMSPEYVSCGSASGPTCDSRYSERHIDLGGLNSIFKKIGVGFVFKVDEIYIDAKTAEKNPCCRLVDVRVSDHLPLELSVG